MKQPPQIRGPWLEIQLAARLEPVRLDLLWRLITEPAACDHAWGGMGEGGVIHVKLTLWIFFPAMPSRCLC